MPRRLYPLYPLYPARRTPGRGGGKISHVRDDREERAPEAPRCELCGRAAERLTRHHLVPRSRTKKKRRKGRRFDRADFERTALLCGPCHGNVHRVLDHGELEREYRDVESLKRHPEIRRFTAWISSKPHGTVGSRARP